MNYTSMVSNLKNFEDSKGTVEGLYLLSIRSFPFNILLATLVTIALYPMLHMKIILWYAVLFVLISYRIYHTYMYNTNTKKFSMQVWYRRFTILATLTAILYASLGFYYIYDVGYYYQLFIVTILVGMSSGSSFALSSDIRLSIIYMFILLLPLVGTLIFLDTMPLNIILSITLVMYFIAHIITVYTMYKQKIKIDTLEFQHTMLQSLFKNAPLGILIYNQDLEIIDCNDALGKLFNYKFKDMIGLKLNDLKDFRPIKAFQDSFNYGHSAYKGHYYTIKGEHLWIEAKAFTFGGHLNSTIEGVGIIEDKTKEHAALEQLEHMVNHDALTGLLNRRGFTNYIQKLVTNVKHKKYYSILFYLDLNQFKEINDSLGHSVGDDVLLKVSKRLATVLEKSSIVSRLGGDEFILVTPYVSQNKELTNEKAKEFSSLLQDIFVDPIIVQEIPLHLQSSIGILVIKPNEMNIEEIIRHADLSMYQAKKENSKIAYYDSSLDKKQKELFMLQNNLAYATKNKQLKLFFQPIVHMKDESLYAAELLIRWDHPSKGLLLPKEFISLAVKAGILSKITWWIIDHVYSQISKWKDNGQWKLDYISINIDATQLLEKDFAKVFLKKLHSYGLKTHDIVLEITERSLIDNFKNTQSVINELKEGGVRCAVDDFGTGYSSLSYLKKLSFDILKIDKLFINDIEKYVNEVVLVNTILDIGRQFNYNIVIEGIETEEQKRILLELDDNLYYQGYNFSKPLYVDEFTKKFLS